MTDDKSRVGLIIKERIACLLMVVSGIVAIQGTPALQLVGVLVFVPAAVIVLLAHRDLRRSSVPLSKNEQRAKSAFAAVIIGTMIVCLFVFTVSSVNTARGWTAFFIVSLVLLGVLLNVTRSERSSKRHPQEKDHL